MKSKLSKNNQIPKKKIIETGQFPVVDQGQRFIAGYCDDTGNNNDSELLKEFHLDSKKEREFFKEYKEIEMLYEIILPDVFLRPFIDDYSTLSVIYDVVRKAYTKRIQVDRACQKKTNELVQKYVSHKP